MATVFDSSAAAVTAENDRYWVRTVDTVFGVPGCEASPPAVSAAEVVDDTSDLCDLHVLVLVGVDPVDVTSVSLAAAVFVSVAASAAAFCASFFAAAAADRLLDLLVDDLTLGVDLGVSADGEPPVAESPVVEPPVEGVIESLVDVEPSLFEFDEPVPPEAEPDELEEEPESPESVGVAQTGDAATADPTPSATASAPTRPT